MSGTTRPAPLLGAGGNDRTFLAALAAVYAGLIALLTLTISPYFSLGWDVKTFIAAGWSLLDWQDPFALYLRSRADFFWPYAYPPLHAAMVALFLPLHALAPVVPESLLARAPVVVFDIGLAWFLHRQIAASTGRLAVARLAAMVWLFNPVTLYQTAVQAHFESEWVLLVLLAYALAPRIVGPGPGRAKSLVLASVLLASAILIKQIAVILAVPFWLHLWLSGRRTQAVASGLVSSATVLLVCLPFALRSPDFMFMNTAYVAEMPVQTQGAVVWLLAWTEHLTSSHTSSVFIIRYATPIIAVAAGVVSLASLMRGRGLYHAGLLAVIVFYLLSPKVMAYYYVIVIPFVLMMLLERGLFRETAFVLAALAWILLSPYYASWALREHLPLYAAVGTVNTLFFLWLFTRIWRLEPRCQPADAPGEPEVAWRGARAGSLAGLTAGLALAICIPILAHPANASGWAGGSDGLATAAAAATLLAICLVAALALSRICERLTGECSRHAAILAAVAYFPLTFAQFFADQESTRILEGLLTGKG